MKKTFLCSPLVIYLLFYIITPWSSGLLYIILKWYLWVREVMLTLTYWNHFLCVFAQLPAPSLSHTNMSVLFYLPTPEGYPRGEHLFPSSVLTACSTGPGGQHCWEFNMNTFLMRREEMGMCLILQVGKDQVGHSHLFWRGVASVNPLLCCPLQNCGCFGVQLTEEPLVLVTQQSLGMNLSQPESYQGAESVFLFNI